MIEAVVLRMYSETEENRFLEVTYANGDKEVLYFKDFNSGAMIQNIVDRGKKMAIKEFLATGRKGMRLQHLLDACVDEFRENEDLPNTTNPDDWARISGKKGERIVYIRTLVSGGKGAEAGRPSRPPATPASTCRTATRAGGGLRAAARFASAKQVRTDSKSSKARRGSSSGTTDAPARHRRPLTRPGPPPPRAPPVTVPTAADIVLRSPRLPGRRLSG